MLVIKFFIFAALCFCVSSLEAQEDKSVWKLQDCEEISDVWNGTSVGFDVLPHGNALYVAFYSYDRNMTIAKRTLDSNRWELKKLPTKVGWDSHNYVTMTFDSDDCLHVAGNMHGCPLNYFRADNPNDIASLQKIDSMTGFSEQKCTYPDFIRDKENRLIFTYRDGGSGNGSQFWNVYDEKTKKWTRLLDKPLFDGQGRMNAYFVGPILGPDGLFHIAWVWRDTPDAATNHDLSYACSPDLVRWQNSYGEPYELPITIENGECVDPVPARGGILNSHFRMAFDRKNRVLLTYTKYDEKGNLQIWNARREENTWRKVKATNWDFTWNFSGGGCLPNEFSLGGARQVDDDVIAVPWNKVLLHESGSTYLDFETLEPREAPIVKNAPVTPDFSEEDSKRVNAIDSEDKRLVNRMISVDFAEKRWVFRWETLPVNRDQPHPDGVPKPTMFRVYKFVRN